MQIHELPLNSGAPADTDAFALDTGSQNFKIDYNALADAILKKSLSAITSAGEYPVKSSVIYQRLLNTAWCFDNSAINTSGNATRAYSVGEYIVSQQNRFYRVKQAVASGEAWAVGTNLESAYVGDILEALNTLTATHTTQISQLNSKIDNTSETDFNNLTDTGIYYGNFSSHRPSETYGGYTVIVGSTPTKVGVWQLAAATTVGNQIWSRSRYNGVWTNWYRISVS